MSTKLTVAGLLSEFLILPDGVSFLLIFEEDLAFLIPRIGISFAHTFLGTNKSATATKINPAPIITYVVKRNPPGDSNANTGQLGMVMYVPVQLA